MQTEERELSPIRLGSIAAFHRRSQWVDATPAGNRAARVSGFRVSQSCPKSYRNTGFQWSSDCLEKWVKAGKRRLHGRWGCH